MGAPFEAWPMLEMICHVGRALTPTVTLSSVLLVWASRTLTSFRIVRNPLRPAGSRRQIYTADRCVDWRAGSQMSGVVALVWDVPPAMWPYRARRVCVCDLALLALFPCAELTSMSDRPHAAGSQGFPPFC